MLHIYWFNEFFWVTRCNLDFCVVSFNFSFIQKKVIIVIATPHDAPPSSLLDLKKGPIMLKSESSWNLMPFLTSNTKGGERGVLKAPGLD
jgi:hypothetical protein